MIDEQENIARQMMDPNSALNRNKKMQMRNNQFDMLGQQNQMNMQNAYMTNMDPVQAAAQQMKQQNQTMGQLGNQFSNMENQQYGQGLLNLQNVMGMRKGEGERLANAHINQVNAHNARRQSNMNMTTGLLSSAMGMFSFGGG